VSENGQVVDADEASFGSKHEKTLGSHLAFEVFRSLHADRKRVAVVDYAGAKPTEVDAQGLLVLATLLAARLKKATSAKRVGIVLPPGVGGVVANLAVVFADKVPVNLNFSLGRAAVESSIERAGIDLLLSAEKVRAKLKDFPWIPGYLDVGTALEEIRGSKLRLMCRALVLALPCGLVGSLLNIPRKGADSEAGLLFTSGSSGMPKGVALSHRNLLSNCLQLRTIAIIPEGETLLGNLPLFHSFGFTVTLWFAFFARIKLVTVPSPLEVKKGLKAIREQKVSVLLGTPTFLRPFLRKGTEEDFDSVRFIVSGAEKTPAGFADKWGNDFGCQYLEGYGLTETSPVLSINLPDEGMRKGSVGKLLPGVVGCVLDADTGEPRKPTETGLLCFRGANVFDGYLGEPERTLEVLPGDGWFHTGDLGRFDEDGFLFIEGRLSRFSKIGGEMVPHGTVEQAVAKALGVEDSDKPLVAIGSKADPAKGESLVLLAVSEVDFDDLRKRLSQAGLANLWIPKEIKQVDEIPMLPTGKLDLKGIARLVTGEEEG
jgi:acyl-[acyl-carrier-protein]-phospholipid O-acyltransferase/long-chain-fatty-acid--[acyl-carrier-protein] ligase